MRFGHFYRGARFRRLTRYRYNNVPTDVGGRYYFIHDDGNVWTPGWAPVRRDLDRFECRHGLDFVDRDGRHETRSRVTLPGRSQLNLEFIARNS
jgi:cellobiose phosphorylase